MKTIKIIHYPNTGNKTTDLIDTENVKIVEGYLHEILKDISFSDFLNPDFPWVKFGGDIPNSETASKYWVIVIYSDYQTSIALMNAEVYIMAEGKTVASFKSTVIE